MRPRSSYTFHLVAYYVKWLTTSWTDGIVHLYYVGRAEANLHSNWKRIIHRAEI